jgi:hypothetical protein
MREPMSDGIAFASRSYQRLSGGTQKTLGPRIVVILEDRRSHYLVCRVELARLVARLDLERLSLRRYES